MTSLKAGAAGLLTAIAAALPEIPLPVWARSLVGAGVVALGVALRLPQASVEPDTYTAKPTTGTATETSATPGGAA